MTTQIGGADRTRQQQIQQDQINRQNINAASQNKVTPRKKIIKLVNNGNPSVHH
jgi:hypothetical protein